MDTVCFAFLLIVISSQFRGCEIGSQGCLRFLFFFRVVAAAAASENVALVNCPGRNIMLIEEKTWICSANSQI